MAKEMKKVKSKSKAKGASTEKLTGLAKYRAEQAAAKAAGKGGKAKAAKGKAKVKAKGKAALPTWKAPSDFKPHFLEVVMKAEKDGLLGPNIKATRYQGRYDPQAEDKKKSDLGSYDAATLQGILARFAAITYAPNIAKRLPPNAIYRVLLRVNRKSADGTLSVLVKDIWTAEKSAKTGRVKAVLLDKTDPIRRKLRRAGRLLPAAFKDVQMPPKKTRGGAKKKDESDDE